MRNLWVLLVAACLLAAPSLGVINVTLTADKTVLNFSETTTVHILAQGTNAGIFSLAGDIVITQNPPPPPNVLTVVPGTFAWVPSFSPTFGLTPKFGSAGVDGGWVNFGSEQTDYLTPDPNFGRSALVEVASFLVQADSIIGQATLSFIPKTVSGYKPVETDKTAVMGVLTPVTIFVPEPVSLALLALGSLLVARRRYR